MFRKKTSPQKLSEELILGHMIKYNLYLMAKSIIFASVNNHLHDPQKAVEQTHKIMDELDLDLKRHTQA